MKHSWCGRKHFDIVWDFEAFQLQCPVGTSSGRQEQWYKTCIRQHNIQMFVGTKRNKSVYLYSAFSHHSSDSKQFTVTSTHWQRCTSTYLKGWTFIWQEKMDSIWRRENRVLVGPHGMTTSVASTACAPYLPSLGQTISYHHKLKVWPLNKHQVHLTINHTETCTHLQRPWHFN